VRQGGTLTINGGFIRGGNVLPGTGGGNGGGGLPAGAGLFLDGVTPTIAGPGTAIIIDSIGGTGGITQAGPGTTILGSTSTFTGPTTVNGGVLLVNGNLVSSTLVNLGGTLGGIGSVGPTTVFGTLAPGPIGGIGTLLVNGAFVQKPGSTYQVFVVPAGQVNPAGSNTFIIITGAATLNGGTVKVLGVPGTYINGQTFTILTASGGVRGSFAGVMDTIPGTSAELFVDPTDVRLELLVSSVPVVPVVAGLSGQTFNQMSVARAVNALSGTGAVAPIFSQITALQPSQTLFALDQLSGEIHASNITVGLENNSLFLRTLAERLRLGRPCLCSASGVSNDLGPSDRHEWGCENDGDWRTWVTPFGLAGNASDNGNAHSFSYDSVGFAVGMDRWLSGSTLIGLAAGFDNWQNRTRQLDSRADVDSFQLGLYAYQELRRAWLLGAVSYENDGYGTRRPIDFLGVTALGNYSGNQVGSYLEGGYSFGLGGVQLQPMGAAQYISLWRDAFSETGAGPMDLTVNRARADSFRGFLGGRLTLPLGSERCWLPEVRAFWVHEYAAETRTISNQFEAGGPAFLIYGQNLGRDWGDFGLGLTTQLGDRVRIGLQYDAYVTPDAVAHGGMGHVQLSW
jgi:outer membrane autotransporter protein